MTETEEILEEMEELTAMAEEMDLLLFTKEEEEFMVVPTLEDSPIPLEDLLNFNGLTVDLLQNPSGVFVVDVERTSSNHNSISNNNNQICNNGDGQNIHFGQYYQNQQQFPFPSDNNQFKSYHSSQFFQQQQQAISDTHFDQQHQQFNELNEGNWVAQRTDVALLDDLLDIVPSDQSNQALNSQQIETTPILDKNQILEEIYREAEEISSRNGSPAAFTPEWDRVSSTDSLNSDTEISMDSTVSYPTHIFNLEKKNLFDHSFGRQFASEELKKSKKSSKSKKSQIGNMELAKLSKINEQQQQQQQVKNPKREFAKEKKRHQNREAALRYRLKKRAEKMATSEELQTLMDKNEYLKTQKSNLVSEIAYLKGFLSEVNRMKKFRS